MIFWAFENGVYNIRKLAVRYFISNRSAFSIDVLKRAMHDNIEVISQEAMIGLEKLGVSFDLAEEIAGKRLFWIEENRYRDGRRNRKHRKESVLINLKERGSKKSLDSVRIMLKKPMNGGKWF